ncbi:MAG: IPT/TIG domain-containing protein [Planctomycetes bacterium]|nr:IPT/TIG domain-containing protein [Planctomycetota bacterium]
MRHAALIAGVILIAAVFAAVWFVLEHAGSRGPDAPDFAAGTSTPEIAPLEGGPALEAANEADPLPAGSDTTSASGDKPDAATESRPDPARVEVQPGTNPECLPGPEVKPGEATDPAAAVEEPVPQAEKADGTSALRPFIKGHSRPPGQNLGSTRPGARRIAKPAGVKQLSEVTPKLMQDRRGLYAQYFNLGGTDLTKLDTSSPSMVRIDRQVYFPDAESFSDLPISMENFAASWDGFLVIPEAGDYWLFWGADNGGRVELDGETVLLQDGMVRYVEVSALLTLEAGLHPLRIEFAQQHNNVADWAKCAANFMWVPEGQTKPVPVPPEMLMVPEWMWSDNAPIITGLSKTSGEIGDEITIHGQNLGAGEQHGDADVAWESLTRNGSWLRPEQNLDPAEIPDRLVSVTVAGQLAKILEQSESSLRIQIPIGARSGDVVVYAEKFRRWYGQTGVGVVTYGAPIPSNAIQFTVTTQFGLMAEWYDLRGWSNFGLEVFESTTLPAPEVVRLEAMPGYMPMPAGFGSHCTRWTGKVGIASQTTVLDSASDEAEKGVIELTLYVTHPCRMTVGSEIAVVTRHPMPQESDSPFIYSCTIHVAVPASQYLIVVIESVSADSKPPQWMLYAGSQVPDWCFFPPVVPPKPPVISDVKAVWAEGEQPVAPPYDVDASRPSVRVGQEFTFDITDYGPPEIWETLPTVSIDGIPLPFESEEHPVSDKPGPRILHCRATLPEGVGEGRMVARLSVVSSEPFYIDVANRGLVAYLYDVPEGSGLGKLPDLGPLTCFKVRKDRAINFEDTADFDLPFPAETFIIEWLGGLIIEEEGDYEFTCRSDDGMKLWLDDNVVLDADKLQAPAENKATVHLVPGVYRFRMQFFENTQHEVCVLEWRATRGEGEALEELIPRQVIPAKAFSLDVHPPLPNKTSTGKRTDGS